MSEMPSAFNETWRTARKEHRCCECRSTIRAGERYRYVSGVWDGQGRSFKQCADCAELSIAFTADAAYPEEAPGLGMLAGFITDSDEWLYIDEVHLRRLGLTWCLEERAAQRGREES